MTGEAFNVANLLEATILKSTEGVSNSGLGRFGGHTAFITNGRRNGGELLNA